MLVFRCVIQCCGVIFFRVLRGEEEETNELTSFPQPGHVPRMCRQATNADGVLKEIQKKMDVAVSFESRVAVSSRVLSPRSPSCIPFPILIERCRWDKSLVEREAM